jgi:hypothetical protein
MDHQNKTLFLAMITIIGIIFVYFRKDTAGKNDYQKKQTPSEIRLNQYEGYSQKSLGNVEKTSVKVHNPPGGKQTFTLG